MRISALHLANDAADEEAALVGGRLGGAARVGGVAAHFGGWRPCASGNLH